MRNPEEMADEEWHFYEEIFPYVKSYLIKNQNRHLLVEGAGLLPHLVKELECPASSYLCLTPTADFRKSIIDRENGFLMSWREQPTLIKLLKTG